MAEEGENWDNHSEDGAIMNVLKNLRIHKTQTSDSDHNSEERASGGDSVTLPCGHQRPAHYIIAWFKYYLKQRQTEFTCPGFNAGQKRTCGAKLSYQDICRLIHLTNKQREFLEEKLCLLTAGKLCNFKACPGCRSFVERRDESNLCVRCTICSADKKQTYTFCWSCLREWKGSTHNAVRCGNEGCGKKVITEESLVSCSPEFKRKKLQEMGNDIYPMKDESSDRKRLALIINNVEFEYLDDRVGADKDELRMERLLKGLGYTVVTLRDLTAQGMKCAMKDFAQRQEHLQSDSCFVVFMSHGNATGICGVSLIRNSDEDIFSIDEIFNSLNTPNCPGLRDKPKIILIQSCRGGKDGCVEVQDSVPKQEHVEKDFCCLRSCTPDTVSYRNTESGSDFFKDIVEVFNQYACEDEIVELFRKVLKKFKENHPCQMPCIDRTTLSKKFFLFPGL